MNVFEYRGVAMTPLDNGSVQFKLGEMEGDFELSDALRYIDYALDHETLEYRGVTAYLGADDLYLITVGRRQVRVGGLEFTPEARRLAAQGVIDAFLRDTERDRVSQRPLVLTSAPEPRSSTRDRTSRQRAGQTQSTRHARAVRGARSKKSGRARGSV